ncbi:MAG: hypothetical protein ACO29U_06930 [Crocinitomicaceae bacterium]|jgi:hypothetical protein
MRLIKQIPHERFLIQLHAYNGKYILSISLDQYEQSYKVNESDFPQIDQIESLIQGAFLTKCIQRFIDMRNDWLLILQSN